MCVYLIRETLLSLDVDLSLDEIMEVYNDEMEDLKREECDAKNSANREVVGHVVVTEHVQCEVEAANKEWRAQRLATEWGTTDDVVTLGNGATHYFFKIPHKVSWKSSQCLQYLHLLVHVCTN